MFDLIIRGGTVYDGSGRPGIQADVAVSGGRIAAVEPLPAAQAARVIDARGKWVTPGFIDIHRHADAAAFRPGFGELELRQGLTTIVNGNCGLSCAPVGPENLPAITSYLEPICGRVPPEAARETLAEYFAAQPAAPLHTGMLAGAGTIRASVAGYQVQRLEPEHYAAIHRRLEGALADGALGVSLGLGYAPECFYTTDELIRALAPLAGQSIPITVHMRQEGGGVVEAAREMVEVARALKAPVHISHLKAMGRDNWNRKIPQVLALLDRSRQEGLDLSCDVYPYTAGSTQLLHILPPEFLAGGMEAIVRRLGDPDQRKLLARRIESGDGFDDIAKLAGWDGIFLTSLHCPEDHPYQGMSLQQIAELTGQDPPDLLLRPAGAGAGGDHHDRLHGPRGGHRRHSARSLLQPDLRLHLSHGGPAPSPGIRHLCPPADPVRPGAGGLDAGGGHPQDDGPPGGGAGHEGPGRADPRGPGGYQRVRPGGPAGAGDVSGPLPHGGGAGHRAGGRTAGHRRRPIHRRHGRADRQKELSMLEQIIDIVRRAGDIVLSAHDIQNVTREKHGPADLVTQYDEAVQVFLRQELLKLLPEAEFFGEEGERPALTHPWVFVVDPIDGTTNFTRRMNCSSVSVALVHNGQTEYGVVYNPFVGELFAAQRGCGATLNGAPIRASSRDAAHAIVACGSTIYDRSYTDRHFAILRHLYDRCLDYRRFASAALDCCMVACGRAEIFFECRLSPWDYAAGSLIAQEAGGVAVRLDGSFLDPLRPGSVFITNAACREMRQGLPE